ncbi:MAG: hypothetical protein C0501_26035 [Isosphaera sp.]|nr:hypothetical protein [Isosphaera sp.]
MGAAMLHQLFGQPTLADFPGPFARRARAVAGELRGDWDDTCRAAAADRRLDELHAARDDYHALLKGHLQLLEHYRALAGLHRQAFGANPAWAEELELAVGELRALYDELFPRWQTAEDLYQIAVEKSSLPADRLRDLAARCPPPTSWLDETDDPFSAS